LWGENSKQYFHLMKLWFQLKSTKEEFDAESRKLMTPEQIHLHNEFLLCLFAKCQSLATFPSSSTKLSHSSVIRDNKLNRRTKVKRRNRSDKGNFEPADVSEYITPLHPPPSHARDEPLRYSAHELFLPDTSLIFGRLLLCAWEQGMEGAEESAAEIIIIAVQQFLKNILMTVLSRRKGYKLRENRFMYNLGTAVPNPWLRNTANIVDDSMNNYYDENVEDFRASLAKRLSLEEIEQRAAYQIACSNTVPTTHYPVTPFQLLEALQVNRNMIPSHTVYSLNTERIITSLNHPTTEEIEATSK
ncbi:hypothetical protein L9F63_012090, partial [Diploptera punctata]